MKLFLMAASLRDGSYNKKLINLLIRIAQKNDLSTDLCNIEEFSMPLYNGDQEVSEGLPDTAVKFAKKMQDTDATVISSPEYNFSTPGVLKNLIDWVSRIDGMPFNGQNIFLMSASPSLVGGNRGLWATRVPLECCGAFVYPKMFSLASTGNAFTEDGDFKEQANLEKLQNMFLEFIKSIK